jgi:hypothetical protein
MRSAQGERNSRSRSRLVLINPLMPYQHRPEPERSHMARKPKTARSNDFAVSPEQVLAVLSDAPAPVRRGRKPKTAATPEPLATMDSDDAVGGSVDADGSIADPVAAPMRKRPGPKPKQRAGAAEAAPFQDSAEAEPGREAQAPDAAPEPTSASATGNAASSGSSQNAATSAQPVAHWDRTTDTVRFDWAEIERTASQDGPNQIMAKLLVAARAEGANSRWPL